MAKTDEWYLERVIWLVAGVFSLTSAILAWLHTTWWLVLTALVGVNLIVFAVTGFCIMANILYALGFRPRVGDAGSCGARFSTTDQESTR